MDGVSPLTVLSIHAPRARRFPQLNNCIHIHPSVRPLREIRNDDLPVAFLRSLPPQPPHPPLSPSRPGFSRHPVYIRGVQIRGLVTGRFRLEAIYDQIARWKRSPHVCRSVRSRSRELQNGGYVMSDQK